MCIRDSFEDLTGDGRPELLLLAAHLQILAPTGRALSWDSPPRIGKPLLLELWGAPGESWLLAYAASEVDLALPPFGTLHLDPTTLQVVAGGTVPGTGLAGVPLAIPASAALVGVALPWQAAHGAGLELGPLERTAFSEL